MKIKKKIAIVILVIIIIIVIFFVSIKLYKNYKQDLIEKNELEKNNIKIDEYNFEQLKKAKPILDSIPKDANKFSGLKKFNDIYNTNIKPIKNCYCISNDNGEEPYIFGFKLYSNKYIKEYGNGKDYYAYPKYDLPVSPLLFGEFSYDEVNDHNTVMDFNYNCFIDVIGNPCEE